MERKHYNSPVFTMNGLPKYDVLLESNPHVNDIYGLLEWSEEEQS